MRNCLGEICRRRFSSFLILIQSHDLTTATIGNRSPQTYIPRISLASRTKLGEFPRIARMTDSLYVIACGSLVFARMPGVSDRPNVSFSFIAGILEILASACPERQDESEMNDFFQNPLYFPNNASKGRIFREIYLLRVQHCRA